MKKKLMTVLALVLVIALSVAGTYAYLTSTAKVVNTFTVGNVAITLDEAKVDAYGVADANAARVNGNTYKLIPGHTYTKDPTIHVDANSEDCWLFVKVANGLGNAATINMKDGWTLVEGTTDTYAYKTVVSGGKNVVVFEEFTFASTADPDAYGKADITVTACAVQADGFNSAEAAYTGAGVATLLAPTAA